MNEFDALEHPRTDDGRFATKTVEETPGGMTSLTLAGKPAAAEAIERVLDERQFEAGITPELEAQARRRLSALVPHLPEQVQEAAITDVLRAHTWAARFEGDPGATAAEDNGTANALVDVEDFYGWCEGDRPDEGGYSGYDYDAMGRALADEWWGERDRLIARMVAEDVEAEAEAEELQREYAQEFEAHRRAEAWADEQHSPDAPF